MERTIYVIRPALPSPRFWEEGAREREKRAKQPEREKQQGRSLDHVLSSLSLSLSPPSVRLSFLRSQLLITGPFLFNFAACHIGEEMKREREKETQRVEQEPK